MANRRGKSGSCDIFYFLGLQNHCSHEIKRCLLLGKKATKNLDSVLKNRDITLLTKVHTVKAMIFPVVMYRCESWTIKKAEHQRTDTFKLWCWRRLLRVPWTARRSNQSILKEISPECSLEGLMLKLQYFGHLMQRVDSLERPWWWKRLKAKGKGEADETVRQHHWPNGHEFEQITGASGGQGSWCAGVHSVTKGQTRLSDWTTTNQHSDLFK